MKTLFCLTEMADSQKLQCPFVHRIKTQLIRRDSITPKFQGCKGLDAHAITAETIGAQAIARLQKRQGHSSVSSQGQYTRHTPSITSRTVA